MIKKTQTSSVVFATLALLINGCKKCHLDELIVFAEKNANNKRPVTIDLVICKGKTFIDLRTIKTEEYFNSTESIITADIDRITIIRWEVVPNGRFIFNARDYFYNSDIAAIFIKYSDGTYHKIIIKNNFKQIFVKLKEDGINVKCR